MRGLRSKRPYSAIIFIVIRIHSPCFTDPLLRPGLKYKIVYSQSIMESKPYMDSRMAIQLRLAAAIDRKNLSGPALRTFFRIAGLWSLSVEQQMILLGLTARSTFFKWRKDQNIVLPKDTLERISYVVGIYKALQILLPNEQAADAWVKQPNTASLFAGRSALDRMLSGQVADLFVVRQYLDAQRGGWA